MVKMINKLTGTEMWVDESRVMEYKALGHLRTAPTIDDLTREVDTSELKKAIKRVASKKKV